MTKGVIKNPCSGAGKAPKKITLTPRGNCCGYGICEACDRNIALTRQGNLMAHKIGD